MVSEPAIRHLKIAFPVQGIVMQLTQRGGAGIRRLFYGRWSSASKHIVFGASDHAPPNFNIPHARIF